jgi:hypothetical protein
VKAAVPRFVPGISRAAATGARHVATTNTTIVIHDENDVVFWGRVHGLEIMSLQAKGAIDTKVSSIPSSNGVPGTAPEPATRSRCWVLDYLE